MCVCSLTVAFFVFTCPAKKQTVPDIKRCKSAFCSRGGAGRGPEMALLSFWFIIWAWCGKKILFPPVCSHKQGHSIPHRHTNTLLRKITTACKQWAHMTTGCTRPTCAHFTSGQSRSGAVLVKATLLTRRTSHSSLWRSVTKTFNLLFPAAQPNILGLSLTLRLPSVICP